jgi:hypothetical protein
MYVGFSRIFLLGILIFKGLTGRSFGVRGLSPKHSRSLFSVDLIDQLRICSWCHCQGKTVSTNGIRNCVDSEQVRMLSGLTGA